MAFRGSAWAKLDDRGRLKLPSLFRPAFQAAPRIFVTYRSGPQVLLYPLATFESQLEDRLDTHGGLNDEAADRLRALNVMGDETEVDAQGRFTLSQSLRAVSGMGPGDEILVIGMKDYLELWPKKEALTWAGKERAPVG